MADIETLTEETPKEEGTETETPTEIGAESELSTTASGAPLTDALEPTDAQPEQSPSVPEEGSKTPSDSTKPHPEEVAEIPKAETPDAPPFADLSVDAPAAAEAAPSSEEPKDGGLDAEAPKGEEAAPAEEAKGDEGKSESAGEGSKDAPVPIAVGEGNATGSSGAATPPTSVEGGDKPSAIAGVGDTVISAGIPSVAVGDNHVAQGVDQQTISAAMASAAARGVTLAGYLQEQGVNLGAAPDLTCHVADKHGKEATKTHREWSVVIKEFYSEDSEK